MGFRAKLKKVQNTTLIYLKDKDNNVIFKRVNHPNPEAWMKSYFHYLILNQQIGELSKYEHAFIASYIVSRSSEELDRICKQFPTISLPNLVAKSSALNAKEFNAQVRKIKNELR